jgi:hypothetical protein
VTWHHVVIVVAALAAVLACGVHPACSQSAATIGTLATVIVGGVFGHASQRTKEQTAGTGTSIKETTP